MAYVLTPDTRYIDLTDRRINDFFNKPLDVEQKAALVQVVGLKDDIPLEKYGGTLQANFDDDFQLGYLLWRADNASGKELKQYAEKTYGKSDTVTNDSILYQKEVGNWNVLVSEEGTISWQDTDILEIVASRPW